MVQGGLLTARPRGVHRDGGAPGGGSSFRQGAGVESPSSPDLETTASAVHRGDREKYLYLRDFLRGGVYRRRGAAREATRGLGAPGAANP